MQLSLAGGTDSLQYPAAEEGRDRGYTEPSLLRLLRLLQRGSCKALELTTDSLDWTCLENLNISYARF